MQKTHNGIAVRLIQDFSKFQYSLILLLKILIQHNFINK